MAYHQEEPMTYQPTAIAAPFTLDTDGPKWIYLGTVQVPIVARTRRTITVATPDRRYRLKRRHLERDGDAVAEDGNTFAVSTYGTKREDVHHGR